VRGNLVALILFAVALGTLAVSYIAMPVLIRLSHSFSFLDKPRGRKRHAVPTPFTGGWLIFIFFWFGLLICVRLLPELRDELGHYLPAFFIAHTLVFVGGVIDDFISLRAPFKLLIQITAASILFSAGLKIDTIYIPFSGSYLLGDLSYPATVLWVLLIVNAMNIVDGLDGLAAGLSIIGAIGLLYTAIRLQIPVVAAVGVILIAVLLGFMPYNFPNARIFMGDSGAQSIGLIFAVAAIYCPIKSYTVAAMFVPLLTLGVPLIELAISFFRRLSTGRSVVRGDFGHLFYLLLRRGVSKVKTVLMFWGVALALQIFVFTLFLFDRRIVFSILVVFMAVIAGWFLFLLKREEQN
jgi:UDP-GlcNAc:undecaprenyl-phosphate/decaprenyl-phosphate GlcNAc-1-phosphate transferase